VIGLVVVGGMLAVAAVAVVAQFFRQQEVDTLPLAAGVTRVIASSDTGDIQVRAAAAGEQPRLIRTLHWSFHRPQLRQAVSIGADTEQVDARCPVHWPFGDCSVDLQLVVPAATALQLDIDTGDVSVTGISGGLSAITTTGDVSLSAVGGTNLSARTNTGDIRVLATGPDPQINASSDTGDVRLSFTSAPRSVLAKTSTGDVTISVPGADSYAVTAATDVGDKTIQVPVDPGSPHSLSVTTSVGDIRVLASGQ